MKKPFLNSLALLMLVTLSACGKNMHIAVGGPKATKSEQKKTDDLNGDAANANKNADQGPRFVPNDGKTTAPEVLTPPSFGDMQLIAPDLKNAKSIVLPYVNDGNPKELVRVIGDSAYVAKRKAGQGDLRYNKRTNLVMRSLLFVPEANQVEQIDSFTLVLEEVRKFNPAGDDSQDLSNQVLCSIAAQPGVSPVCSGQVEVGQSAENLNQIFWNLVSTKAPINDVFSKPELDTLAKSKKGARILGKDEITYNMDELFGLDLKKTADVLKWIRDHSVDYSKNGYRKFVFVIANRTYVGTGTLNLGWKPKKSGTAATAESPQNIILPGDEVPAKMINADALSQDSDADGATDSADQDAADAAAAAKKAAEEEAARQAAAKKAADQKAADDAAAAAAAAAKKAAEQKASESEPLNIQPPLALPAGAGIASGDDANAAADRLAKLRNDLDAKAARSAPQKEAVQATVFPEPDKVQSTASQSGGSILVLPNALKDDKSGTRKEKIEGMNRLSMRIAEDPHYADMDLVYPLPKDYVSFPSDQFLPDKKSEQKLLELAKRISQNALLIKTISFTGYADRTAPVTKKTKNQEVKLVVKGSVKLLIKRAKNFKPFAKKGTEEAKYVNALNAKEIITDEDYNRVLSTLRAMRLKLYFNSMVVEGVELISAGKGQPKTDNDSQCGSVRNCLMDRRVDMAFKVKPAQKTKDEAKIEVNNIILSVFSGS